MRFLQAIPGALYMLWLLFLPPWRRPVGHDHSLGRASGLLAWAAIGVGSMIWVVGGLQATGHFSEEATNVFWEQAEADESVSDAQHIAFNLSGSIGFVSFLFTPTAWVAMYLMIEGTVRFAGYWSSREATGSLIAYPLFITYDLARSRLGALRRDRAFGEAVPDELVWDESKAHEWDLQVTSARDLNWRREIDTIRVGGAIYQLLTVDEERTGGRLRVRYRLCRWPDNIMVRSVVEYELPVGVMPPVKAPPVQKLSALSGRPVPPIARAD